MSCRLIFRTIRADFENVVAQTMGIQAGTYRLLPVKTAAFEQGQLPVRLSLLTMVDFTRPRHPEREWDHLVEALKGPLARR